MRAYPVAALLMLMASASSASEAFVRQLSVTKSFRDFSGSAITGKIPVASAVATPLSLTALKAAAPPADQTNTSHVTQQGTNNLAVVSQTGGRNLSSLVQSGTGNQAIVTQRH